MEVRLLSLQDKLKNERIRQASKITEQLCPRLDHTKRIEDFDKFLNKIGERELEVSDKSVLDWKFALESIAFVLITFAFGQHISESPFNSSVPYLGMRRTISQNYWSAGADPLSH
jgi:hypothetical protein